MVTSDPTVVELRRHLEVMIAAVEILSDPLRSSSATRVAQSALKHELRGLTEDVEQLCIESREHYPLVPWDELEATDSWFVDSGRNAPVSEILTTVAPTLVALQTACEREL